MTDTVTIWPRGVRTEVPVDVCRCPVLEVGDACPVHQQILDVDDLLARVRESVQPGTTMRQLYLTVEEITVMLRALAWSVDPFATPADATEASVAVWRSDQSTPIQRSLATALAEATYR